MAKNTGWLWALGAAVVGGGAWLFFSKKASAQVVKSNSTSVQSGVRTFIWSRPITAESAARMAAMTQEDVAEINAVASQCLPSGRFQDVLLGDLRQEHSNSERILLGYKSMDMRFSVATVPFDETAAIACLEQGL